MLLAEWGVPLPCGKHLEPVGRRRAQHSSPVSSRSNLPAPAAL